MSYTEKLEDGRLCRYYSPKEEPFTIHGLYNPLTEETYRRVPKDVAENTSKGVADLSVHTSGGRIRFATDSPFIVVSVKLPYFASMGNMCASGSDSCDLYMMRAGVEVYTKSALANAAEYATDYCRVLEVGKGGMREYTLNMPLYNGVKEILIGIEEGSKLAKHSDYRIGKPVVYYGSSITQGGCASRPGLSYQAMISRKLDCEYLNLGFSGNCKGEKAIVDYIAGLDMCAFVLDYDHNAPTVEHLQATHKDVYTAVRAKHPDIPIVMASKPDFWYGDPAAVQRRNVVYKTYIEAFESGDTNVYFVDGSQMFDSLIRDDCTVDGCHPNDLGMYGMARHIGAALEAGLRKSGFGD